ncbi:hypothetical protein GH714_033899 [Hevea brasiliensis]|uniref:Alpha-D-phosphohexomutase alpha/beta/alpha domain-containing protein n=1 Tax=Hevea brasiliensis TaxID=3981 RepID=A0A6A6L460_HEVBR|nr:hypothetical protein GH714_033899 [Hevea brasiliensis]
MSGKIVQNVFVAQNRLFGTQYRRDCCAPYTTTRFPSVEGSWHGLAYPPCKCIPYQNTRGVLLTEELYTAMVVLDSHYPAASSTTAVPYLDKVDFLKLQNGRLASTPAMFNSTLTVDEAFLCPVDGAIMITVIPYNRNGFKFFTNDGGLGKADIKDILERAADIYNNFTNESLMKSKRQACESVKKVDYMTVYTSNLVKAVRKAAGNIEKPLEGFHIIVDAGNGAGGFFAAKVLQPLGAITNGSQFLEPDGLFPNHIPNPEDKVAMKAITQAVLQNKADLGIIFDTDVDRSAAVDSTGREFNRNRLIALMSAIVLEEHPGTTIVTDSVTSDGLTTFIEKKLGGKHHRFKRGYKNVIDEAIRLVKLLNKLASARASGVGGWQQSVDQSDLSGNGEAVLKHLENSVDLDPKLQKALVNYEGTLASDPVLPLNIEAPSNDDAVKLGLSVASAVKEFALLWIHLPWTNLSNHDKCKPVRFSARLLQLVT